MREEEYKNGRSVGYRKFIDFSGETIVANYNERGNRDGESKRYNEAGILLARERYADGSTVARRPIFTRTRK